MKLLIFIALSAVALVSCKKDDNPAPKQCTTSDMRGKVFASVDNGQCNKYNGLMCDSVAFFFFG